MRPTDPGRTLDVPALADAAGEAQDALRRMDPIAAAELPKYLAAHEAWPEGWAYGRVPAAVAEQIRAVHQRGGDELVGTFHRTTILTGLVATRERLVVHDRWAHALPCFDDAAARIVDALPATPDEVLTYPHDAFSKNVALATGRLWHAKAQLVEPRLGVARGRLLRSGAGTIARAAAVLARIGGHAPLYEIHTYEHLLHWFTEDGWSECYRMIALALSRDPAARGVFVTAWFFDPALAEVSPRIAYLYRFPADRGAVFLRVRNGHGVEAALSKSETRRQLFAEGKYAPQEYLMIWPRAAMVDWLRSGAA